jgi:DNA-directed RNA polymerase alpha subunit
MRELESVIYELEQWQEGEKARIEHLAIVDLAIRTGKQDLPKEGANLSELDLSSRVRIALWRGGIWSIDQLCDWGAGHLLKIRGIGSQSLTEIRCCLAEHGLHLRGEGPVAGPV